MLHQREHGIAALARFLGEFYRLVVLRRLRHRRQRRGFGERELRRALAEIVARGALDSVPAVREANLIEIRLEDLLLVVVLLHLPRGCLLAKLSAEAHVAAIDEIRMHVADELLRDGARSAALLTEDFSLDRAGDADHVHAVVLIETLVLDRDKGLPHVPRQRPDGYARSKLIADFADQGAIARENLRRLRWLDDAPRVRFA